MLPRLPHGRLPHIQSRSSSTHVSSPPQTIFSGIQPTGIPHLGNYLGALRQWVTIQNASPPSSKLLFCVVDSHALTIRQDRNQLQQWKKETLATLLAIGLDPKKSILFYQSSVLAHDRLHWLLSCTASMGYLSRMTQWKSKLSVPQHEGVIPFGNMEKQRLKLGLFSYPVLQAADVLVHGATHVPIGEDQVQHIEFARECAGNFNAAYGEGKEILISPVPVVSQAKRIMSLKDPKSKMSKSAVDPGSRILLTDEKSVIEKKISSALTDSVDGVSYDVESRPGVSNLIDILVYLSRDELSREDILQDLKAASLKALKAKVAEEVESEIYPIRESFKRLIQDEKALKEISEDGTGRARASAAVTLDRVTEAVALERGG